MGCGSISENQIEKQDVQEEQKVEQTQKRIIPKLDDIEIDLDEAIEEYKIKNTEQERKVTSILKMGLPSTSFDYIGPSEEIQLAKVEQLDVKLDCDVDSIQEDEEEGL